MRRSIAVLALALFLSGCPKPSPGPGPIAQDGATPPRPQACDPAALRTEMGSGTPDLSGCAVPALVTLLGEEVRRAKAECRAFAAFTPDWPKRTANWVRLLDAVEGKAKASGAQSNSIAESAVVVRDLLKPMLTSADERRETLNTLLKSVNTLEGSAQVPSPVNPECS